MRQESRRDDGNPPPPLEASEAPANPEKKYMTVRQAAFIGVGAMVGAGIFALLGATAGAANAGLYPAQGLSERLAETGQFPPLMAGKFKGRASTGLLIQAAVCLVLAVVFNLDSIASIGSAVALVIFTMITAAHLRIRAETGANLLMLILAIVAAGAVFVTFVFTTLIHEPASIATLAGILVLSVVLDYGWKHFHAGRTKNVQLAH